MTKKTNSKSRTLIALTATAALCLPLLGAGTAEARTNHHRFNSLNSNERVHWTKPAPVKRPSNNKRSFNGRQGARLNTGRDVGRPRYTPGKNHRLNNGRLRWQIQKRPARRPARPVIVRPAHRPMPHRVVVPAKRFHRPNITVCRTVPVVRFQTLWLAGFRITMPIRTVKKVCTVQPAAGYAYNF